MPSSQVLKFPNVDFSGGSLGQIAAAYDPFLDSALVPMAAWDADDPSTYTLDGSNNVLTLPSKFNTSSLTLAPFDPTNTTKWTYQSAGWTGGGVNPRVGQGATGCFSLPGQTNQYGSYTGLTLANLNALVTSLMGGTFAGLTVFALAQRGVQNTSSALGERPLVSFPGKANSGISPPFEESNLGVMSLASDAAQLSAVCGQHQSILANNAPATPFGVGSKAVLCAVTNNTGQNTGVNGSTPAGAASYFGTPFQNSNNMFQLGGAWNYIGGSFTGLLKAILVYPGALTTAQMNKIYGYLAWRGGIQSLLAPTQLFYGRGPLVTD